MLAELRQHGLFQPLLDGGAERLRLRRPIRPAAEMRHRRQHVEAVAPLRRQRRVRHAGAVQVEAEILRQVLLREDVLQQRLVARAEHHGVVVDRIVPLAGAEVPDKQAHRIARLLDLPVGPALARVVTQQLGIGPADIGVGDDDIGADGLARGQGHAGGAAFRDLDPRHLRLVAHAAAQALDQPDQPLHQRAHAAHGVVDAVRTLQMRDQAVIRRGGQRIAADQQRMEAECDPQLRMAEIVGDLGIDRAVALQADQVGHRGQQRAELVEGLVDQLGEGDVVDLLAVADEAVEATGILRRDARDLRPHGVEVRVAGQRLTVVEADLVEGVDRPQVHVIGQAPPGDLPQLLQQVGRGDDGRAGIEGEAVLAEDIGAAARAIQLLQHRHPVAAGAQPHRGGQPTKARADDHGMRSAIGVHVWHNGPRAPPVSLPPAARVNKRRRFR